MSRVRGWLNKGYFLAFGAMLLSTLVGGEWLEAGFTLLLLAPGLIHEYRKGTTSGSGPERAEPSE